MLTPNLFSIATSELSQDAFLTWLLQWADSKFQTEAPDLHKAAQAFLQDLIGLQAELPTEINKVTAGRQWHNIDVWSEVNDTHLVIIEDKTGSGQHSNQLERYRNIALDYCKEKKLQLVCVYLKTQSECLATSRRITEQSWATYSRHHLLEVLEQHPVDNDIYKSFISYLRLMEDSEAQFHEKPLSKWSAADWIGLYRALDQEGVLKDWDFVNNVGGGFWNAIIEGPGYRGLPFYMQIQQGALCFKVGEVYEDRSQTRNHLHHLLVQASTPDLPLTRPGRFGNGTYMTVAEVPAESWMQFVDGKLDLPATVVKLKAYQAWMHAIS